MRPVERMRTELKFAGVIASILLAFTAFIFGWYAARYWSKASKVKQDPDWRIESPDHEMAHEAWIAAILKTASESADLNRKAADLTKWAVVLGTASSVLGALAGLF